MSTPVALVFPGQGSQRHGMLEALDGAAIERLLDAAEALSGLDLRKVASDGTTAQLQDTRAAQPLLYLVDLAWGLEAVQAGIRPVAVAGHSLGEFAALALAGVFSPEAGLSLVVERSRLMAASATANPGGMVAVLGLDADTIAAAMAGIEGAWVANDNAPGQIVLSGTFEGLERARAAVSDAGAKRVVPLEVAGPFHTPLVASAADTFAGLLSGTEFEDASIPVVQNSEPVATTDAATIRARLARQMVSPVRWTETMNALVAAGAGALVECGPGRVLSGLAKRVPELTAYAVEDAGIDAIAEEVL